MLSSLLRCAGSLDRGTRFGGVEKEAMSFDMAGQAPENITRILH